MIICQWFDDVDLQMELSKENGIYYLDSKEIDKEIACKIINLSYKNAKEIL